MTRHSQSEFSNRTMNTASQTDRTEQSLQMRYEKRSRTATISVNVAP